MRAGELGFTEGGLVHAVSALANLAADYDVRILCPNLPESSRKQTIKHREIEIICMESSRWLRWMRAGELSLSEAFWRTVLHWPTVLADYRGICRYVKAEKPDVLIGNGMLAASLVRFVGEAPLKVGIIHHLYHTTKLGGQDGRMSWLVGTLERAALRLVKLDRIGVVNPLVQDILVRRGFREDRIVVVGNGVNTDDYLFSERKVPNSLIYIGSLRKLKGVDLLIEVVSILKNTIPGVTLHIVGDGPKREEVKRRIAALGISDSVVLHGYVPEREKVELLSNCAVYVSNSRFEGFGIPVVEAMATGTVPVVSNIGGHEFILQGQDAGYLVDSVEEMAVKIADLLTHEARRSELARNGRKLVEEKWTWVKVSEKYRKLVGVA